MKVAITHLNLPSESKGGVAYQAHYFANKLVESGHDVTVFSFSAKYAESKYQVRQYRVAAIHPALRSFHLAGLLAATDFSEFDLIHTFGDNYLMWGKHPQIRTFCGSARDEAKSATSWKRRVAQRVTARLEDMGARVADLNVGISEATRLRIPAISHIIPCGVDLTTFRSGVKLATPAVLFVGTTGGRKRGAWLRDVFVKEVRPNVQNAELWCVTEKPMEGDGVVNLGKVSVERLAELFRQAWVFCLPSLYEGFGIPYIEAMASGTVAVATPNLGACEVLGGGQYGVLAKDQELGQELVRLLRNPESRQPYEERGVERAKTYSWDTVAAQYETLYRILAPTAEFSE